MKQQLLAGNLIRVWAEKLEALYGSCRQALDNITKHVAVY
jgi:hypothetical protein